MGVVIFILYLIGNRFGAYCLYLMDNGDTFPMVIFNALVGFGNSYSVIGIFPSFKLFPIFCGMILVASVGIGTLYKISSRKKYRSGEEYGSAEYGDIKKLQDEFKDEVDNQNMICSKNVQISMNTRKTFLNNNICVIGGSGSGKTRFFNKPNILQMNCNYVVTDPKTSLIKETANAFYKNGYDVKIMDFIHTENSMHYNPFVYIKKPLDVYKFVNNLVANTKDKAKSAGGDEFFEKAEIALLHSLLIFLSWLQEIKRKEI